MSDLIPKHGGYRKLKGFQVAQLAFDITVRFVDKYVDRFSRTKDQMVQAARSGVQNIAEGSEASATSKKMEIKLTQVARASLEELRLDYEDFLRQRDLPLLAPDDPVLQRFKKKRPQTLKEFRLWVKFECDLQAGSGRGGGGGNTDAHGHAGTEAVRPGTAGTNTDSERPCQSVPVRDCPCSPSRRCPPPLPPECLVANGVLSLLNLACWFLDRQVERLAKDFESEGGFTERLYKVRSEKRRNKWK